MDELLNIISKYAPMRAKADNPGKKNVFTASYYVTKFAWPS